jgi:outer membrane protein insertion porin family
METKERGFLPFLSPAIFRMDVLLEDLVAIKRLYEESGYLDAEVVLDDLRVSDDKSGVCITIAIVEHQPYCIGGIEVDIKRLDPGGPGAPPPEDVAFFTEQRLRDLLGLHTGQRYSAKLEKAGRDRIRDAYYCRSYIDARVPELLRQGRQHANVVDLKLRVEEGAKSRVRQMAIVGNEYTRDRVLRREVRLSPGGYVNRGELDRALGRMRALGYFDRVTMQVEDVRCTDGTVQKGWKDVTYEVVEGSTGSLNFGVGLSTDGGVFGSVTFTKRNFDITRWPRSFKELTSRRAFTGAGQKFDLYFQPGTVESQFRLGFEEPHLFGTELGFGLQAYKSITYYEDWTADRLGYNASLSYPILMDIEDRYRLRARLKWRHEEVVVGDVEPTAIPGAYLFRGSNEVRSLALEIAFDTVDDLAEPRRKSNTLGRFEYMGGVLGGDVDVLKFSLSHEHSFVTFVDDDGRRQRLTLRGEMGWARAFDDTPEVPPFERYFMGGNRLRGFRYRGAGPHVGGNPTGGEWIVLTSAEYLVPLVKDTVGFVVFVDAGTLGTNVHTSDAWLWRASVGAGLRLRVPMLGPTPLAFDFGFPLLYEDSDERTLISFSVGRDF